jgi:hypothetical protein
MHDSLERHARGAQRTQPDRVVVGVIEDERGLAALVEVVERERPSTDVIIRRSGCSRI